MELRTSEDLGGRAVEGPAGQPLMGRVEDTRGLIEACWYHSASAALLYAENLTPRFFDLSSGEAGGILQQLQNYRIRLAVVCPPGVVSFSPRFRELVAEAKHSHDFQVFERRDDARAWLLS